jgi:lysyl oxidase
VTRLRLLVAICLAVVASSVGAASPVAAGAVSLLPDLQMAPLFGVQLTTTPAGRHKLRFGTLVNNVGDGAMEVRADDRDGRALRRVVQWIYRSNGTGYAVLKPDARVVYQTGDGHHHFHVLRFNLARVTLISATTQTAVRHLRKIGFCLVDSYQMPVNQRPPNSASARVYGGCGTIDSTAVQMGISVGWGDTYPPEFAGQAIDVTGLPKGNYRLCVTANAKGIWDEKNGNLANNSYWLDLFLNVSRDKLTVVGSGATPC